MPQSTRQSRADDLCSRRHSSCVIVQAHGPAADVLSLPRLRSYISGGFDAAGDWCLDFPAHEGIKFQAIVKGTCQARVKGVIEPLTARAGNCYLLPRGRAFRIGSRLDMPPLDLGAIFAQKRPDDLLRINGGGDFMSLGGYCDLESYHAG